MATIIVLRDGEVKMRIGGAEIRADGQVWAPGGKLGMIPMLDRGRLAAAGIAAEQAASAVKAGKSGSLPATVFARLGVGPDGLECLRSDEYERRQQAERAAREAAKPAAQRAGETERAAIEKLFHLADRAEHHDTDEDNVSRYVRLRAEARTRLAAWRQNFPALAREEKRTDLLAAATHQDELAVGAGLYDSDGWLNAEAREQRAGAFRAKAAALRAEAAQLEN